MRSADESETSKVVPKSEGRPENQQGEAGIISVQSDSGISVPVQSIANLTTALITSAIPLTVLQNGLSLSAPLMVSQSTFQNTNPSVLEFKGQAAAQLLPNDLGLRLVAGDRSFKPPIVIGLPAGAVGNPPAVVMPIKMETNDDDFSETDDESSSNQEWASPSGSALHSDESAVDYSVNAPNYTSAASMAGGKSGTKKMKTSSGPRRSGKDTKLTPEEEERRKQRRERNKLAAAKCRQKRVDQTNTLLAETQVLEEEQSRLEEEIKKYQQQKEELEFVLEAHRLHCGLGKQQSASSHAPPSANQNPPPAAPLPVEIQPIVKPEVSVETAREPKPQVSMTQGQRVVTLMQRPTSFPVASRSHGTGPSMLEQALGIPMSTPSSGIVITLGLDSMLDGHTGLTPITGVPSIVAQTPQIPPGDTVPSSSGALTPASSSALMSL